MTLTLYVDVMSLLKQVITTIFYIILIKIEFIIMTDRYYVSCHESLTCKLFSKKKVITTYRGLGVETDYIHFFPKMG